MNLRLRDAMRGVAWERKWRGTLEEYPDQEELEFLAPELAKFLSPPSIKTTGWPTLMVGLGTYHWKYGRDVIEKAIELGVGLIDTAEGYGFGKVETRLGDILENGRGKTWIATKVARNHLSYEATLAAGRRSRDRLKIDSIDLYQVHWPNPDSPLERTLDAFAKLKDEGTIRRVGVSNFCAGQLSQAIRLGNERGLVIESNQIRLNSTDRGSAEYLVDYCKMLGVKVIAYSPLGQGSLGKKAEESLRWVLSKGVYAIPRTNNVEHLESNLRIGNHLAKGSDT